ncbi:MAG: SH3 domain-containing protein [Chloroflexota bacterium]
MNVWKAATGFLGVSLAAVFIGVGYAYLSDRPPAASTATVAATSTAQGLPTPPAAAKPSPQVLAASVPTATAAPVTEKRFDGQPRWVKADGEGVRIRSECSTEAAGVGAWPDGTAVGLDLGRDDCEGWYRVVAGTQYGWVRAEYLSETPPPTPVPTATVVIANPGGIRPGMATMTAQAVNQPRWGPAQSFAFTVTPQKQQYVQIPVQLRAGDHISGSFSVANGRRIQFGITGPNGSFQLLSNGLGQITVDGGPIDFQMEARQAGWYALHFQNPGYFMSSAISGTYWYQIP